MIQWSQRGLLALLLIAAGMSERGCACGNRVKAGAPEAKLATSHQALSSSPTIAIQSATYGGNCNSALAGNETATLTTACGGQVECNYYVNSGVIGDPAGGCGIPLSDGGVCASTGRVATRASSNTITHWA